ncbi:hypothetical protein DOTSEDRAFT_29746 [Dothistroma septosporum NZE10]|uniref:Uncharacterized protein n=1 Tax=Dothistroma septosporum (strain NZE10 / CBS 128990) TaxID=675120 RepID=M2XZR1_DOTSN|nr:hypothetical protein DOTSEDRAFT_29746 [Dothistroma septosporum NZE10]
MCALRDGTPSPSGESSALFVTPSSSSERNDAIDAQRPELDRTDDDDELYRCTPDLVARQASSPDAAVLRESYLAARRDRVTSRTPSPRSQQEGPPRTFGPFLEDTSSLPSGSRSISRPDADVEHISSIVPQNDRRKPFYQSEDQDAAATWRAEQHHPIFQGQSRDVSETLSHPSFPGVVQQVSNGSVNLEDTEMVDAPSSQEEERASSREIPSSSPLSSRNTTPEIQERDWEIVRIEDSQIKDGIRERKIAWQATRHSRALMRTGPGGKVVLNVAGVRWGGMREQTVEPQEVDDNGMVRVYWATTWHPDWDLPKDLVARWERRYGDDEGTKEEKQLPRWWLWPEQTEECLPPEPEPDPGERELMPLTEEDTFTLEAGKDYTISFLEQRRRALTLPVVDHGVPDSTILRFLNMRVRNRLRIADDFEKHHFRSNNLFVRTSLIYIFGTAMLKSCSHCREGGGPYPRCVTWLGELSGACCNCSYFRRGSNCEYHFTVRWIKAPKLPADRDAMDVDDGDFPPFDDPSIDPSSNPTSTPPSSDPNNSRAHVSRDSSNEVLSNENPPEVGGDNVPDPVDQDGAGSSTTTNQLVDQSTTPQSTFDVGNHNSASQNERPGRIRSDSDTSIKSEEVDASYEGKSTFHHDGCLAPPAPCRDRVCGRLIDGNYHSVSRVFRGETFAKGQATDEQVNFILSCCTCTNTQALQQAWEKFQRVEHERNARPRYQSREQYFSHDCWRVLNQLITWCPEKWSFDGEIDLTHD